MIDCNKRDLIVCPQFRVHTRYAKRALWLWLWSSQCAVVSQLPSSYPGWELVWNVFFFPYIQHCTLSVWWVWETHYAVHRFPRQHLQYRLQYLSYLCWQTTYNLPLLQLFTLTLYGFQNSVGVKVTYHLIGGETKAAGDRSAVVHGYCTSYHAMLSPCGFFLFVNGKTQEWFGKVSSTAFAYS